MAGLNVGGSGGPAPSSSWPASGSTWSRPAPNDSQSQYQPGTGATRNMSAPACSAGNTCTPRAPNPMMVNGIQYLMGTCRT